MMTDSRWLTCYRLLVALSLAAMGYLYSEVRYLTGWAVGMRQGISEAAMAWQEPPGRRGR